MATYVDGKAIAAEIKGRVRAAMEGLPEGVVPGLATLLVGDDYGAVQYRGQIERLATATGFHYVDARLPADAGLAEIHAELDRLAADPAVHGILPLRPFPEGVSDEAVIDRLDPLKDIDGFHPDNLGRLLLDQPRLVPSTARACLVALDHAGVELKGKEVVVVGRSATVGKPVGLLCMARHATVTTLHSRTRDLAAHTRRAEVVIVAIGRARFLKPEMIREGAVVIDVGINWEEYETPEGERKGRLVGDADTEACAAKASVITPVPGGIGAITNACLLENTLQALRLQGAARG
ncbi:MAG: bifunctional 5,10-methylenetetrahydrofolate dehydrogenase/5,10-methenyltetrahydrofolate cyclohydrolase [Nitrospirae bacterium]|nr:MAG: bifunctional 5,10-methylenetetrahydrofolate dehydrogenase/5,10-methenyltetrahydrofolate cyclohydrolase [Nitrospirota bacterium]